MISPNTCQDWTPDGLVGLIIPGRAILADVLESITARRLIDDGAQAWICTDGQTCILSLKRPPGAVALAVTVKAPIGRAA